MQSYWDGRKIVWTDTPAPNAPPAIIAETEPQVSKHYPLASADLREIAGRQVVALKFAENVLQTKNLRRVMGVVSARPKPGKDGSIRSAYAKMAIAAWRNARVMGKPGRGDRWQQTARMDVLDVQLAERRELRREMLARVRVG